MRENLSIALGLMFGHEGGYSNHPSDPGGPTKYGVTHKTLAAHRGVKSVTAAQVKALTLKEAEEVYRRSYWTQSGGDLLPPGIDYMAFDYGVNSGPARAIKSLQKVVGVAQDGIVGGQTVSAVKDYPGGQNKLIKAYAAERLRFLRGLNTWGKFGNGWSRRVNEVQASALKMAAGAKPPSVASPPIDAGNAKANPADTSIVEIVKKEPTLIVSLITALGTFAAGAGPLQWALAAGVVVGIGYGIYRLVKRERANA